MIKNCLLALITVAATSGAAHAGGQAGSIGVGAEFQLSGAGGPSVNYDAGQFHLGGFLSMVDPAGPSNTLFEIGGGFFWHVHKTAMSDFGIGGSIGIESVPPQGGMAAVRTTDLFIEPSFQIRLFLSSNVALSFTAGIVFGAVDAGGLAITGQGVSAGGDAFGAGFAGGAGVHYYFF
ncbi:MAG: hypothetical protein JWO36_876 [Myxococcales bacterium]|nr:hypothetical protein [Myxococcales bacterium]